MNAQFRGRSRWQTIVRYKRKTGAEQLVDLIRIHDARDLDEAIAVYREDPGLGDSAEFTPKPARIHGAPGATFFHKKGAWGVTVGVVAAYGEAFVLSFVAPGDKPDDDFLASIKTFVFLNEDQRTKLARNSAGALPPGWKSLETPHYDIQYDCEDDFARELGKHLEAILLGFRDGAHLQADADLEPLRGDAPRWAEATKDIGR